MDRGDLEQALEKPRTQVHIYTTGAQMTRHSQEIARIVDEYGDAGIEAVVSEGQPFYGTGLGEYRGSGDNREVFQLALYDFPFSVRIRFGLATGRPLVEYWPAIKEAAFKVAGVLGSNYAVFSDTAELAYEHANAVLRELALVRS